MKPAVFYHQAQSFAYADLKSFQKELVKKKVDNMVPYNVGLGISPIAKLKIARPQFP